MWDRGAGWLGWYDGRPTRRGVVLAAAAPGSSPGLGPSAACMANELANTWWMTHESHGVPVVHYLQHLFISKAAFIEDFLPLGEVEQCAVDKVAAGNMLTDRDKVFLQVNT